MSRTAADHYGAVANIEVYVPITDAALREKSV